MVQASSSDCEGDCGPRRTSVLLSAHVLPLSLSQLLNYARSSWLLFAAPSVSPIGPGTIDAEAGNGVQLFATQCCPQREAYPDISG